MRIGTLAKNAPKRWENWSIDDYLSFGFGPEIDNIIYGVDIISGEYVYLGGKEKGRKTTLLMNVIWNWGKALKRRGKGEFICLDTLESGVTPSKYTDSIIAMIATRWMIAQKFGHYLDWPDPKTILEEMNTELRLSRKTVQQFYSKDNLITFTPLQKQGVEWAIEELENFPLSVFGASKKEGLARDISKSDKRHRVLAEGKYSDSTGEYPPHKVFIVDNYQQLSEFINGSYQGQENSVRIHSDLASEYNIVFVGVQQESLTSQRESNYEPIARGGKRALEEANIAFTTNYDHKEPDWIYVINNRNRDEPAPPFRVPIDRFSGAFIGPAETLRSKYEIPRS